MRRQLVSLPLHAWSRRVASVLGVALVLAALVSPALAEAGTVSIRQRSVQTVTADALPTVQINGVVWTQVIIGNVVYAGGEFTSARPAGAAGGTQQIARKNLLAYDITTGKLITTFVPGAFNGAVKALAVSADKKTLYVGGAFTKVGSTARGHYAALNVTSGKLGSAKPSFNSTVNALAVNSTTVYAAGQFTAVNGHARSRLAAVTASTGALTKWVAKANSGVNALVLTSGSKLLVVGGMFTKLNSTTASGSGAVSPSTGKTRTWRANTVVKNGGKSSAILSLVTDGSTVYASAYTYGTGNFEGVYAASSTDGSLRWLQDCHGDTYDVAVIGDIVYSVGHAHYCSNIGGFPDTSPRKAWYRALAVTKSATGTVAKNGQTSAKTYTNFAGKSAPGLINWFPDLTPGTYTGMTQAAWSVVGNGTYVALGGEFTKVNGTAQQGLVRMAVPAKAPRKMGPVDKSTATTPKAVLRGDGSVAVSWLANWDRDDLRLTYRLSRNGVVINTQASSAPFWARPTLTFVDAGAAATGASTARYSVTVSDADGNAVRTASVSVTLPTPTPTPTPSPSAPASPSAEPSGIDSTTAQAAASEPTSAPTTTTITSESTPTGPTTP